METTTTNPVVKFASLKEWRDWMGFDQRRAGEFLGVSQSHYSNLERGSTTPRRALRKRILEKTGITLEALLGAV